MFSFEGLNGQSFERLIFGTPREGVPYSLCEPGTFSDNLRVIIDRSEKMEYPKTTFGEKLYEKVQRNLIKNKVQFSDLRLLSALNTEADYFHETDGFFYCVSEEYECVVTIDAFYISPSKEKEQRELWIDMSPLERYNCGTAQSDLFRYNRILAELFTQGKLWWGRLLTDNEEYKEQWASGYIPPPPHEDRPSLRPENHLILTPYYLVNSQRRSVFAGLITESITKQIEEHRKEVLAGT